MRITISGLTGSGKTTIGIRLAETLGVDYWSGSSLRAEWFGLEPGPSIADRRRYWSRHADALRADTDRLHSRNEQAFDLWTAEMLRRTESGVFDVWFLPWLLEEGEAIRIWLDAPFPLRAERVASERVRERGLSLDDGAQDRELTLACRDISAKDRRNREYALKAYGIDIDHQHDEFEILLTILRSPDPADLVVLLSSLVSGGSGYLSIPELLMGRLEGAIDLKRSRLGPEPGPS